MDKKRIFRLLVGVLTLSGGGGGAAFALTVTPSNDADALVSTFLGADSGLVLVPGSAQYGGGASQSGFYSGFDLTGTDGSTISNPDGIVLTSGSVLFPSYNSVSGYTGTRGAFSGDVESSRALLSSTTGLSVNDVASLTFSFTVADPARNAISTDFVFASDEYPEWTNTEYRDIFVFVVDGENYATLPGSENVGVVDNADFISNTDGIYPIEYDGLSPSQSLTALLDPGLTTHTLTIAIGDTGDTVLDSAVFIKALSAATSACSGIACDPISVYKPPVPEPGTYAMLLAGLGIVGAAARKRKQA